MGLGGGADAVSALVMARIAEAAGACEVHYGNTKRKRDRRLELVAPQLAISTGDPTPLTRGARHGTADIECSLPRGPGGSPLVALLPRLPTDDTYTALGTALAQRRYEAILGIDTGGDILKRKGRLKSRDFQMLRALARVGPEPLLVIFGLCSDGVLPRTIEPELDAMSDAYLGYFPLAPWRDVLESLSSGLRETRTPRIIVSALDSSKQTFDVPRGGLPRVDRRWLIHGFVFRAARLLAC